MKSQIFKKNKSALKLQRLFLYSLIIVFLFQGCISIEKYNAEINTIKNVQELKCDVDYMQRKLETLHPDLYHYISKSDLNYKFDSLRKSIITPMTSNEFYFKISPIISSIKQGHIQLFPLTKKLNPTEDEIVRKNGTSPLSQFDFELFENKLYIVKNYSKDSTIKSGTEVLLINAEKPEVLLNKYRNTFSSDGYNHTYIPKRLAKGFSRFFFYQNGITDSICLQLKYNDSIRVVNLKRQLTSKLSDTKKSKEELIAKKKIQQEENKKRNLLGYDPLKKTYSKQLYFPQKDSSVAVLKISDFMKGNDKLFYKKSFKLLDSLQTKSLILDLRDNSGGRLNEVNNLYSYLADSSFHFLKRSEVTSKTSLWHNGFFDNKPQWFKLMKPLFIPSFIVLDIFTYLVTSKGKDNKYKFSLLESGLTKPKSNHFKGKIYVIINGGSFSASSLLSSNLKGSKRALFIGQETGGANNGCVAGIMPYFTLPKSKLQVKFGLLLCQTPYISEVDGRGVFPEIEITPTLENRKNGKDPEIEWILNNINRSF
jgi:C-terminal processing protease CtpA/Prc